MVGFEGATRRRWSRAQRVVTILLRVRGLLLQGVTLDLSYRGLMVRAGWANPEEGVSITGRIILPGLRVVSFEGQVRWTRRCEATASSEHPILAGIQFTRWLDESYLSFVRAALATPSDELPDRLEPPARPPTELPPASVVGPELRPSTEPGRYSISTVVARRGRLAAPRTPVVPLRHGALVATAASLPIQGTEQHDFVLDDEGRMVVVIVQSAERMTTEAVLSSLRPALQTGKPSVLLMSQVDACLAGLGEGRAAARASVAILRFSSDGENVEIVNAGLPPVLCVRKNGEQVVFPGSAPHGEIVECGHGDVFMLVSSGVLGGGALTDELEYLAQRVGLARHGHCIAAAPAEDLQTLLREHVGTTRANACGKDATLILVGSRAGRSPRRVPANTAPAAPLARIARTGPRRLRGHVAF